MGPPELGNESSTQGDTVSSIGRLTVILVHGRSPNPLISQRFSHFDKIWHMNCETNTQKNSYGIS